MQQVNSVHSPAWWNKGKSELWLQLATYTYTAVNLRSSWYLLEDGAFFSLAGFSSSRNQLHWRLEIESMSIWWIPKCSLTLSLNCYFLVSMRHYVRQRTAFHLMLLVCSAGLFFLHGLFFSKSLFWEHCTHQCRVMMLAAVIDKT